MNKAQRHLHYVLTLRGPLPSKGILDDARNKQLFTHAELKEAAIDLKLDTWEEGKTRYWGLPGTKPKTRSKLVAIRLGQNDTKRKGA